MPLHIELEPGERVFIGESLVENAQERFLLHVIGNTPVLREKDVLNIEAANTTSKLIYIAVQLMHFSKSVEQARENYLVLVKDLIEACPSTTPYIARISAHIFLGNICDALKEARLLIEYEDQLASMALPSDSMT